jgi:outer membrane protein OmpA-like peptidoglycan-associated protein
MNYMTEFILMNNTYLLHHCNTAQFVIIILFGSLCSIPRLSVGQTLLDKQYEQASNTNIEMLAPQAWADAGKSYLRTKQAIQSGQNRSRINALISETEKKITLAEEKRSFAQLQLQAALNYRAKALIANSISLANDEWTNAENALRKIASSIERNKKLANDRLQKQIATTIVLYDSAELEALTSSIMIRAIATKSLADFGEAKKYAPETYGAALALFQSAELTIAKNRYEKLEAERLAEQAERKFKHAMQIALTVYQLRNKDITEEELLLQWESRIDAINLAASISYDELYDWDTQSENLISYINKSNKSISKLEILINESRTYISSLEDDLRIADEKLLSDQEEIDDLIRIQQIQVRNRERLLQVENLFKPNEAVILSKGSNIILRLTSIQFESGSSIFRESNTEILEKAGKAIAIFPGSMIAVEGHTDANGSEELNIRLSEERAKTVMRYMIKNMYIEEWRFTSIGFGSSALNTSSNGRAKNRSIDIIISPSTRVENY